MTVIARRDRDVRDSVQNELEWMPQVEASRIGVSVEDGAVTLSGEVDDFAQRVAAKRAALRVRGVRTVIDHLTVYPKRGWPVSEREIAGEVERALKAPQEVELPLIASHVRDRPVRALGLPEELGGRPKVVDPWDRRRSREAGFDHHLTKPVDLEALARVLG